MLETVGMTDYDVVVIGSGVGGYTAAIRASQLGLKTACVEGNSVLGGTCLNNGCIPSKSLLHATGLFDFARTKFAEFGIRVSPKFDLSIMMSQKQASVDALGRSIEDLFDKNGVDRIEGWARLNCSGRISVRRAEQTKVTLSARHVVIATGSIPSSLPGVVVDQNRIVDSTGALALREPPRRLLIIGAGCIGLELGSVWRRLGSDVEVVEAHDRIIPGADEEISRALRGILEKQNLRFRLLTMALDALAGEDEVVVRVRNLADGTIRSLKADVVLSAVGRQPFVGDLGLEAIGLSLDKQGFIPTEPFATAVPGIWAVGDVTRGPMLAHKAEDEAIACIELLAGRPGRMDYDVIPNVIYTSPEVAWVGETEAEVRTSGRGYRVGRFPFSANSRARLAHESEGFVKVISSREDYRILGVHMIGPQASEIIGEACVAMAFQADGEDVARTCHPHPTRSEALRQAAMGAEGWMTQA
ncbi:MAG: lpdA [Caulobacteraceae bacterium]|nr:lpdA [Caulobacteraceae bacterium]